MTFIAHIDARHILMHNVPARILALKPPLDFPYARSGLVSAPAAIAQKWTAFASPWQTQPRLLD